MENELNYYNWEIDIVQNGFQHFNDILKKEMSPLKTATISPMIVQRDIQKNIDTDELTDNKVSFSIPTEDEWEYLCNGGSRIFFRWGDTLNAFHRSFRCLRFFLSTKYVWSSHCL